MKHIISLIGSVLAYGGLVGYIGYLYSQGLTFMQAGYSNIWIIAIVLLLLCICYYTTLGYSVLRRPKTVISVLGIVLIYVGYYIFIDTDMIYLSDLTRIVGVGTLIGGVSGLFEKQGSSDDSGSPVYHKDAEIIEI